MPSLLRLGEDGRLFAALRERLARRKFAEGMQQ
jgi:hypothetical protein